METVYSVLGAILPLEAYQYTFMKNAFLAVLLLTPLLLIKLLLTALSN